MQGAILVELSKKGGFTTNKPRSLEFTIVLQKHKLGRSNRVLRRFGSRRVLQVSVPPVSIRRNSEALREFFSNKFVLNGRVFEAVCAKDHTVYLLETSDYDPSGSALATWSRISNAGRMSLFDFMQWHNPIAFNGAQASCIMFNPKISLTSRADLLQMVGTVQSRLLDICSGLSSHAVSRQEDTGHPTLRRMPRSLHHDRRVWLYEQSRYGS
jgi:hypothetical protein